ncbi:MAG: hypothetical protein ACM3RX_03955 [Methanococcaceae archaeon]
MYKLRYLILIAFILISKQHINAQSVDELLRQGDGYAERDFNNEKALDKYKQAEKVSNNNWEICWRLSRTYLDIADHMPASGSEQKEAQQAEFQKALNYAEKTVQLAPSESIGYIRRAAANGKIALFKGVFSAISLVNKVKADAEKSIKLGSSGSYIDALSHYILGRTHMKVCEKAYLVRLPLGLGWGDMDKAEVELKKAVDTYPNFRMFYLELAKYYIEESEYQKAKENLYKVQKSPKSYQDDDKFLAESKKLLEEIKNK